MTAKTSIILCTFNEANYIENTISELEKNIPNLEIVIVDDCSTDGTTEIIKRLNQNNKHKVIYRKKSKSLASAFVRGVVETTGENIGWIMGREILPNILPPLVAEFGLRFCYVFLMIASLSFLGVGIQPPTADWGSMVRETGELIQYAEYDITAALTPLLPAAAIGILTIGVNFVVDWFLYLTSGLKDEHQ